MLNTELSPKRSWRRPRSREAGEEVLAEAKVPGGGGRGRLYLSLHCHHHNDACIKMGGDESHFNVSVIVRDRVTRQCPQTTTFKERGEPKRNRTEVLLLTSLTPYRQAKPASLMIGGSRHFIFYAYDPPRRQIFSLFVLSQ